MNARRRRRRFDDYPESKAPPIAPVALALGMRRKKNNRWLPCPNCGRTEKEGQTYVHAHNYGMKCSGCDTRWNAYGLVHHHLTGQPAGSPKGEDFLRAKTWLEENITGVTTFASVPAEEVPNRIPVAELKACFQNCLNPAKHEAAAAYLRSRKIDPAKAAAGVLPEGFIASWWPAHFSSFWPLVIPAFDGKGQLSGIHGCAIDRNFLVKDGRSVRRRACKKDQPHAWVYNADGKLECGRCHAKPGRKTTWPRGIGASKGLVFANFPARKWLRGTSPLPESVMFVEGATDFLAITAKSPLFPVLGYESGSHHILKHLEWKRNATVYIATDHDVTGHKYAAEIKDSLPDHVRVGRIQPHAS